MKTAPNTKYKIQYTSAYTLIEILVSLTIIGILFGFGYASFRDFARRQEVAGAAKVLQGNLRLAQQQALSGQKPDGCGTLDGVRLNINTDQSYLVEAVCGASVYNIKPEVKLPSDIRISSTQNLIQFNVLGNGTNISDPNTPVVISLTQTGTGYPASVTVSAGGEIK